MKPWLGKIEENPLFIWPFASYQATDAALVLLAILNISKYILCRCTKLSDESCFMHKK